MRSKEDGLSYPACRRASTFRAYTHAMYIDAASRAVFDTYKGQTNIEFLSQDIDLRRVFQQRRPMDGFEMPLGIRGYGAINGVRLPFNPAVERMHQKKYLDG